MANIITGIRVLGMAGVGRVLEVAGESATILLDSGKTVYEYVPNLKIVMPFGAGDIVKNGGGQMAKVIEVINALRLRIRYTGALRDVEIHVKDVEFVAKGQPTAANGDTRTERNRERRREIARRDLMAKIARDKETQAARRAELAAAQAVAEKKAAQKAKQKQKK